jgi:hypothetical protein
MENNFLSNKITIQIEDNVIESNESVSRAELSRSTNDKNKSKISKLSPTFTSEFIKDKFTFTKNMRSNQLVSTLMLENARLACYQKKMPQQLINKDINDILETFNENKNTNISVIVLAYTNVAVNNYNKKIRCSLFNEKEEDLKPYYETETLVFSGLRDVEGYNQELNKYQSIKYYSSYPVYIKEISIETLTLPYINCDCKDSDFLRVKCKKHQFRRGNLILDFYKIIDQHNTTWFKPVNIKQFYLLSWQYKQYCINEKDKYTWSQYYECYLSRCVEWLRIFFGLW